jgi:hypothetical protein
MVIQLALSQEKCLQDYFRWFGAPDVDYTIEPSGQLA